MKTLVRVYFEEAKWCQRGHVPNFDEYMEVALVSSGYQMLATHSLVCMGEFVTEDVVDGVSKNPLIVRAASVICRLMDDMAGHEVCICAKTFTVHIYIYNIYVVKNKMSI